MTSTITEVHPDRNGLIIWGNGLITLTFRVTDDLPVMLEHLSGRNMPVASCRPKENCAYRIIDVLSSTDGRYVHGKHINHQRYTDTKIGGALRFESAHAADEGARHELHIIQFDPESTIRTDTVFDMDEGVSAFGCMTTVSSDEPVPLEAVSSLCLAFPLDAVQATIDDVMVCWADSTWAAENNWHRANLREVGLPDINKTINPRTPAARFEVRSLSAWSTGEKLPTGIVDVQGARGRFSAMWQIENNGPWSWELGEGLHGLRLYAGGPNFDDHQWSTTVDGAVSFTTVHASLAICNGDWQDAVDEITLYRRALYERGHSGLADTHGLVVYNDYMNTLFGKPTADKEIPLIAGASKLGVDIYTIDCGWYDSTGGSWWDSVGEWEPSTNRFGAEGLSGIVERIHAAGMGLGLWLEPEVIGVKSPMAKRLPDSAFFQRHGRRVMDSGRFLLDFRSPEAREHLDRTVDRLVEQFNPVFFKFDYNTVPGSGTDYESASIGEGLLGHCRAYAQWIDDLRRRHPNIMFENCASGAMRADYAMLSRLDLQSTSDQCDPLIYAAIGAAAPMSILPEQEGNWGYAQQSMDEETAVLTLSAGILGRLYVSGFVNLMDESRLALVRQAIAAHRQVLASQRDLVPFWPLGFPDFETDWLAVGLKPAPGHECEDGWLTVWRRNGSQHKELHIPSGYELQQAFPSVDDKQAPTWNAHPTVDGVELTASSVESPSARVFRLHRL